MFYQTRAPGVLAETFHCMRKHVPGMNHERRANPDRVMNVIIIINIMNMYEVPAPEVSQECDFS